MATRWRRGVSSTWAEGRGAGAVRGIPDYPDERPAFGQAANALKQELTMAFEEHQQAVAQATLAAEMAAEGVDVTLPGRRRSSVACTPATTPSARSLRSSPRWAFRCSPAETWRPTSTTSNCSTFRPATRLARCRTALHHQSRCAAAYAYQPRPNSRHAHARPRQAHSCDLAGYLPSQSR